MTKSACTAWEEPKILESVREVIVKPSRLVLLIGGVGGIDPLAYMSRPPRLQWR